MVTYLRWCYNWNNNTKNENMFSHNNSKHTTSQKNEGLNCVVQKFENVNIFCL